MSEPRTQGPLSAVQLTILELEAATWRHPGAKHTEFRRRHPHVTETAYYLALHRLLDDPRALEVDAGLIHRLRRLRAAAFAVRARGLEVGSD